MIRALIIDDEEKSRITLQSLVTKNCPSVEILELCDSVDAALKAIEKHKPGLIFLDIEMPFKNGFNLLEKIKEPDFEVVFTTAYQNYAIQAIKFSAMDYLLKPIDVEELKAAVKKAEAKKSTPSDNFKNFEMLFY